MSAENICQMKFIKSILAAYNIPAPGEEEEGAPENVDAAKMEEPVRLRAMGTRSQHGGSCCT